MGDAARPPMPPPVIGVGEAEREMKGLRAGDGRSGCSLFPSTKGEGASESRDEVELVSLSLSSAPSAAADRFEVAGEDDCLGETAG